MGWLPDLNARLLLADELGVACDCLLLAGADVVGGAIAATTLVGCGGPIDSFTF